MTTGWHGYATAAAAARLRPMAAADLADVIALEHELFPEDPWSAEMFADEVARPAITRLYLVAETGLAGTGLAETGLPGTGPAGPGPLETGPPEPGTGTGRAVLTGYAGMMFVPGGHAADVLTIAVHPAHWGAGIGSALLGALLAEATVRGCTEVFLEVRADNPRAQGLYARRGFAKIGVRRGYYQPSGMDAIVMRKDLRATGRA